MTYYMPTKVYEELDAINNHASEIAELCNGKAALIVTGRHSSSLNGSLEDLEKSLNREDVDYLVFDRTEENPSVENLIEAVNFVRENGVEIGAVIGLGGGSPMDAAKAVSVLLFNRATLDFSSVQEITDFLYGKKTSDECFPVIAVPTTCGTGSEVTAVSVVTRNDKRTKGSISYRVFPRIALVDPKYIMNAPASVICNTAVDAFGHLVESFINRTATPYSRMLVRAGLMQWQECKGVLLDRAANSTREESDECAESPVKTSISYAEAASLMRASTFAGMAIAQTGTSLPHGLSYGLTYELGVPHGKAVGQFLGRYIAAASPDDRQEICMLAGFEMPEEVDEFIYTVCGKVNASDEVLENQVAALLNNRAKLELAPFDVDEEVLREITGI